MPDGKFGCHSGIISGVPNFQFGTHETDLRKTFRPAEFALTFHEISAIMQGYGKQKQ